MAERKSFGTFEGKEVQLAVLRSGKYKVAVTTYGAALVWYGTEDFNAVLSYDNVDGYLADRNFYGLVVGPVANRVANHSFALDGVTYTLEANDGPNCLHSGSACYGKQLWSILGQSDTSVTMALLTPEGQGGFPGSHATEITYSLTEDGILTLAYSATSSKKCPVALTNHAYFRVSSKGSRGTTVTIPAQKYVEVDSILIPTGVDPVEGTDYDFRTPTLVGARREGKYDNTWVLDKDALIVADGDLATIWCRTTEPGVQLYTGENISGEGNEAFAGLCLETGRYPDTPNRDDYPKAFTEENKAFVTTTSYRIEVKG